MQRRLTLNPTDVLLAGVLGLFAAAVPALVGQSVPVAILLAPLGVLGIAVAIWRPMEMLYVGIALIPLGTVTDKFGLPLSLSAPEVLFAVGAFGWLVRSLGRTDVLRAPLALTAPALLLVVSIVPGLLVAESVLPVIRQLALWSIFFVVFLMIASDGDMTVVRRFITVLAFTAGVLGVIALADPSAVQGRVEGPFSNPNVLAMFIAVGIPCQVVLSLSGRAWVRIGAVVALLAGSAGMILTLSRGGLLAILFALTLMVAWPPLRRFAVVSLLLLLPFTVLLGANPIQAIGGEQAVERFVQVGDDSTAPVSLRLDSYTKTPQMFYDHPLFGVGAGNFRFYASSYGLTDPSFTTEFGQSHSFPLTTAANQGVLGIGALIWLAVAVAVALTGACRRLEGQDQALAFALAGAFAASALWGLFHDPTFVAPFAAVSFALLGCVAIVTRTADRGPAPA